VPPLAMLAKITALLGERAFAEAFRRGARTVS
jgi:hypothetical protein